LQKYNVQWSQCKEGYFPDLPVSWASFVINGIPHGIAGLSGTLAFGVGFFIGGMFLIHNTILNVFSALFFGLLAFFGVGAFLKLLPINLINSIVVFLLGGSTHHIVF